MSMHIERVGDSEITAFALAARDGDRTALERFIQCTQRDVWRYLAHLDGPAAADDLAQETYLRALRGIRRFTGRSTARTWLLSIARRVAIDQVRRARVRPRTAAVGDWRETVERSQPTGLPGFDEGIALADLLSRLEEDRRDAFVLTQIVQLTYAETAEVCGCPVGTIRSRVARARDDLIGLMAEPAHDPPGDTRSA